MLGAGHRASLAVIATLATAALLTACAPAEPTVPTNAPSAPAPSASAGTDDPAPTDAPEAPPALDPDGDAEANLPYFAVVVERTVADAGGRPSGRTVIDALVAAGFEKDAMQLTADATPLGNPADAIQFSVQLGETCLLGQVDASGATTATAPALGTGGCLIGATRSLDW